MGNPETRYKHFTLIADGIAGDLKDGFVCESGPAFMGMKVWASSYEEAAEMIRVIGRQIGFSVTGDIEIYNSDPKEPCGDHPHGYEINFTPYGI